MPVSKKRTGRGNGPKPQRPSSGSGGQGAALYHRMKAEDDFETVADILFQMVSDTARKYPGKPRSLYIDIEGHRNEAGGYDQDAYELLGHFIPKFLGPFLTRIPLIGGHAINPKQREDLPEVITISPAGPKEGREERLRESARRHGIPVFDADSGNWMNPDGTAQAHHESEE